MRSEELGGLCELWYADNHRSRSMQRKAREMTPLGVILFYKFLRNVGLYLTTRILL